jgi:hypothetical protein
MKKICPYMKVSTSAEVMSAFAEIPSAKMYSKSEGWLMETRRRPTVERFDFRNIKKVQFTNDSYSLAVMRLWLNWELT